MGKLTGSKCVSVYLFPSDIELFNTLREQINHVHIEAGEPKLKKNETWRLMIRLAAKYCEQRGGNARNIDSPIS